MCLWRGWLCFGAAAEEAEETVIGRTCVNLCESCCECEDVLGVSGRVKVCEAMQLSEWMLCLQVVLWSVCA